MDNLSDLVEFSTQIFGKNLSIAIFALFAATLIPSLIRHQVRIRNANQIRNRAAALENMNTISNEMFKRMFFMFRIFCYDAFKYLFHPLSKAA